MGSIYDKKAEDIISDSYVTYDLDDCDFVIDFGDSHSARFDLSDTLRLVRFLHRKLPEISKDISEALSGDTL